MITSKRVVDLIVGGYVAGGVVTAGHFVYTHPHTNQKDIHRDLRDGHRFNMRIQQVTSHAVISGMVWPAYWMVIGMMNR